MCLARGGEGEEAPRLRSSRQFFASVQKKMYRTQAGQEIEGYNFFKKMMQQQFKMPKKTTGKKERK